jgi:Na+-driven multidrug efflux pump
MSLAATVVNFQTSAFVPLAVAALGAASTATSYSPTPSVAASTARVELVSTKLGRRERSK